MPTRFQSRQNFVIIWRVMSWWDKKGSNFLSRCPCSVYTTAVKKEGTPKFSRLSPQNPALPWPKRCLYGYIQAGIYTGRKARAPMNDLCPHAQGSGNVINRPYMKYTSNMAAWICAQFSDLAAPHEYKQEQRAYIQHRQCVCLNRQKNVFYLWFPRRNPI